MNLQYEEMSPVFGKWHLRGFPFESSIHYLRGPDTGPPHDHPFNFTSFVLKGWYIDEHYDREGKTTRIVHSCGTTHHFNAEDVHRITEVSEGGCWTIILPTTAYFRTPRFWQFNGDVITSKAWYEI